MIEEDYDFIFKLVIIGDSNVGKTGILTRYLSNQFNDTTKATIGVEFGAKKINVLGNNCKMQIWDTAGQERYRSVTNAYYKGAKGALIVYDITRRSSFESVERWVKEIKVMADSNLFIILLGNKSDQGDLREVSIEEGQEKAKNLGVAFLETSAKTAQNVDKAFEDISKLIVDRLSKQVDSRVDDLVIDNMIDLNKNKKEVKEKKCC